MNRPVLLALVPVTPVFVTPVFVTPVLVAACQSQEVQPPAAPVVTVDEWSPQAGKDAGQLIDPQETHFASLRQLTFGGDNAEAYWSPDGHSLVFQARKGDGDCDQQYIYNLDSGEITLLSSGKGRTTCGYYDFPDGKRFIYATTESGGDACPPEPDRSKGYTWGLYESYELVWQDGPGTTPAPFLPSPGYDAEATICFSSGRIVFTSVRDGDLELYSVNPDGSDLVRLTSTPGYDGGAFFTNDCQHIVWRSSRPEGEALAEYQKLLAQALVKPAQLDIYVMKADGTDVQRLTDNGAANFGPYPTPGDKAVLYSSNAGHSVMEFDLFMVPMEGGQPQQVTFAPMFDGFPMFSPDGKWLVFGSNRGGNGRATNLFVARWRD